MEIQAFLYNTRAKWQTAEELYESCSQELRSKRFSISVFIFLQSIIQDQAAGVPSTGMSAGDLKEKLDCLKEIH